MISAIFSEILLRQVPKAFRDGLARGELQLYGSVIRSVRNGRIVGFLQETGGFGKGLRLLGGISPLGAALKGMQLVQAEQIKASTARIEQGVATLKDLALGATAVGIVNLGVTIAAFAIISAKIDGVRADISGLGDRLRALEGKIDALRKELIDSDLDDLRAIARSVDEAWSLKPEAAARRWAKAAEDALRLQLRFERRSRALLGEGPTQLLTADPLLDAVALAGSLRVTALALNGEAKAALMAAGESARLIGGLTAKLGEVDLARAQLDESGAAIGSETWNTALAEAVEAAKPVISKAREREYAAGALRALLAELERRGIELRAWLNNAKEEGESPVLILPATSL